MYHLCVLGLGLPSLISRSLASATPIVSIKNNIVVCNSRDVADYFSKRHDNVLRDIATLLSKIGSQAMFTEIKLEGRTGFGVRHYRAFDMTRDGFTLLAMGFTGKKALQSKLRFIEQYKQTYPLPTYYPPVHISI